MIRRMIEHHHTLFSTMLESSLVAKDSMFFDGLEDAETGRSMGTFAQDTADTFQLTREDMDAYAIDSVTRAYHDARYGPDEDGALERLKAAVVAIGRSRSSRRPVQDLSAQ